MGDDCAYWIDEWAGIRQDEVVRLPESFPVHPCFLTQVEQADLRAAFAEIWNIFYDLYGDISRNPERFRMPLYRKAEYGEFSAQARDSRSAAYRPLLLLYALCISGQMENGCLAVDSAAFSARNTVRNTHVLFDRLSDYGFQFQGIEKKRVMNQKVYVLYPDNPIVLVTLKLMADKADRTQRVNDFLCCHYKLFADDMDTVNYGYGADVVADKLHTKDEQECVYALDAVLREKGYCAQAKTWKEGPGYAYYDSEKVMKANGPYLYWLISWKSKLLLYLRIRNATRCLEYIERCPPSVRQIFLHGDGGCAKHTENTCVYGQEYTLDGVTYWRCGCCNAPFSVPPLREDIGHYIQLVDLGVKK